MGPDKGKAPRGAMDQRPLLPTETLKRDDTFDLRHIAACARCTSAKRPLARRGEDTEPFRRQSQQLFQPGAALVKSGLSEFFFLK